MSVSFNTDDVEKQLNIEQMINAQLGFEDSDGYYEDTQDDSQDEQPFNADKIRIDQQMLSVKYLYELFEDGGLETNPEFQRKPVWTENKRKSLLIESLMLRIPIPAFYFYENEEGKFQVIDGQQRLMTIFEFLQGKFKLSGLEYVGDVCNHKSFSEIDGKYKQRIYRTQLAVNVLDARSPYRVIYDIFRRINTGGISLTPQEMRNAICQKTAREFLREGIQLVSYLKATRNKISDIRMDGQELFLRFIAFYRRYNFFNHRLMEFEFSKLALLLDDEIIALPEVIQTRGKEILSRFEKSMTNCEDLFGKYAFVKIVLNDGNNEIRFNRDLINKSLFMSFSVILADYRYDQIDLEKYQSKALVVLAKKLREQEFMTSISGATGDRRNILICFRYAQEVVDQALEYS